MDSRTERRRQSMSETDLSSLPVLDYPPLREDLDEARAHIDEYGMALVANVLSPEEVAVIDARLTEQVAGEDSHDRAP